MNQAPSLADASAEALMSRAADDFLSKLEKGERFDIETFVAGYPQIAGALRQVLPALQVIRQSSPGGLAVTGPAGTPPAGAETGCLGDFRLLREVGRGGMGIVYEAEQISLGRRVALKILPFAAALDSRQLQRFKNEATAAANLHHTNIVPVYFVGQERGVHFYAMQFIEGQTLAEVIEELRNDECRKTNVERMSNDEARMTKEPAQAKETKAEIRHPTLGILSSFVIRHSSFFRTVAELGIQAADALEHAHQIGIVHRDIKPGNLLLEADAATRGHGDTARSELDSVTASPRPRVPASSSLRLWITDFGLAQFQSDSRLTMTGDILGTLRYMSPEQALAKRVVVDHRTDIYSLGVTLYELLALQPAFAGQDRQELLRQIAFEEPKPLRRLRPNVPTELETIVLKAMAKNPDERYASARHLADDLRRFLEDRPIQARRPGLVLRTRKWARRHPSVIWSAVILLIMAVIGLTASVVLINRKNNEKDEALRQAKANLHQARQVVNRYFTRVSEETLFEEPTLEPFRKQLLQDALKYYQGFVTEHADDPELQAELVAAHFRITNLIYVISPEEDWLTPFQKGVAVMADLMRKKPDASTLQSLEGGLFRPLPVHLTVRQPAELMQAAEKARVIWAELVRENPTIPGFKNDLAIFHLLVAIAYQRSHQPAEAVRGFEETCLHWQHLMDAYPSVPQYRVSLVITLIGLGGQLSLLGQWQEMDKVHERALELAKKLTEDDPTAANRELRYFCWMNIGVARADGGRFQDAEEMYRQALGNQEGLVRDYPQVARFRHDVLHLKLRLAGLHEHAGELEKAESMYRQVMDAPEPVVRNHSRKTTYQRGLRDAHWALGDILWITGRQPEAAAAYRKTQALLEEDSPGDLESLDLLVWFRATCTDPQFRDPARAVDLAKLLVEREPQPGYWLTLGVANYAKGDFQAARDALAKATNLSKGDELYLGFFQAMTHWQLGDKEEAFRCYDQAVARLEKGWQNVEFRRIRAEAAELLGIKQKKN